MLNNVIESLFSNQFPHFEVWENTYIPFFFQSITQRKSEINIHCNECNILHPLFFLLYVKVLLLLLM